MRVFKKGGKYVKIRVSRNSKSSRYCVVVIEPTPDSAEPERKWKNCLFLSFFPPSSLFLSLILCSFFLLICLFKISKFRAQASFHGELLKNVFCLFPLSFLLQAGGQADLEPDCGVGRFGLWLCWAQPSCTRPSGWQCSPRGKGHHSIQNWVVPRVQPFCACCSPSPFFEKEHC